MSTKVYVVYSTIQHKWEQERYVEIEGVALQSQALASSKKMRENEAKCCTLTRKHTTQRTDKVDEESRDRMINEAFMFMDSIYRYYGEEKGEEMWDTIITTLDPSIKRHMLMRMFAGDYKGEITIRKVVTTDKKVHIIKKIREITGLGLKEAKEIADQVCPQRDYPYQTMSPVTFKCDPDRRRVAVRELEELGCII